MSNNILPRKVIVRLPPPHKGGQDIFLNWNIDNPNAQALIAPCGTKSGKALALDTPIATPKGWATMESLSAGDHVFDENGKPVEIIYKTETMYQHRCYEVIFSDGHKIVADAEHLWVTETHADRRNRIITTEEIRKSLTVKVHGINIANHCLPVIVLPAEFKNKSLCKKRYIVDVREVESVPVCCIRVDSPTNLFLAGKGLIPTHNSFGSALWLLTEAMTNPGFYCCVIAPTYLKCRIIYRYIKRMLPPIELAKPIDGKLEIWFANGTTIKFLHGRDAETVIEGEAVDRFVIDEAGKINRQVWYSLFTTITQTGGKGIVTGTPRGHTWYYDLFVLAQSGDSFFVWVTLPTSASPYVTPEAIETARRLLPHVLFVQYYLAQFVTHGSVFGDLTRIFYEDPNINPKTKFWVHPDIEMRKNEIVHGIDVAKKNDYTIFYSVNARGQLVGYCRFKQVPYPSQVIRLKTYLLNYFSSCDNHIKYDATGVGVAFGDMLNEADIDAAITPVIFTNRSKNEMVTKTIMALDSGFHKAPRILRIVHEFSIYELSMTTSGLYRFSAPEGEHDDVVSAAIIAISEAYASNMTDGAEKLMAGEAGELDDGDMLAAYLSDDTLIDDSQSFFDDDSDDDISGFIDDDID